MSMSSRTGPVHVATTRRKYKGKVYETHLLRRTYREGGKVKHETVGNISHLPSEIIDIVRRALKGEIFSGVQEDFEIVRSLPHGHVAAVLGMIRKLKLETIISPVPCNQRDLVMAMIVSRILAPCSKLATARGFGTETLSTSLGEVLGIESSDVGELYRSMDWLLVRQAELENALASGGLTDGSLVLYDVTSVYVEGDKCPLAQMGYNRDGKKGKKQIVVGLLCSVEGCPIAVEVYEGNTADPKTLSSQIAKIRTRFGVSRVVLVGDRGMITEARLRDDLRCEKVGWITALRSPAIRKLVKNGSLQLSLFDETDLAEISDPDYPDERLVVCKNPFLAHERARKREDLLQSTEKRLNKVVEATMRQIRRLKGKEKIALRVGKVLDQFKMAKHFCIEIQDESFRYCRNQETITSESSLDGIYVIRTSLSQEEMSAADTILAYKGLSRVERAFRILKSIDLQIRPIFHWTSNRIKSHVLLCMLAYYVEWHMKQALAPMLFEDHDRASSEALRQSVVAPAKRSLSAMRKIRKGKTSEGLPVHSFRTLIADLGTLTKNRIHIKSTGAMFDLYTTATPSQNQAFKLLGVSPRL